MFGERLISDFSCDLSVIYEREMYVHGMLMMVFLSSFDKKESGSLRLRSQD